ncbi:MAG: hypothetical protein Tp152SUR00d2C52646391_17 [Prokaryotic dsDNA virus sp.]|nr:MAG: hypothetical protein Tp152SUR00d2C52646391_17 [Prokaryotic dsDNA virus sp.]|tara:strand:- start:6429 stop:6683 length:255 start_codon:yes stop_codon:yes gene_type:complete
MILRIVFLWLLIPFYLLRHLILRVDSYELHIDSKRKIKLDTFLDAFVLYNTIEAGIYSFGNSLVLYEIRKNGKKVIMSSIEIED